MEKLFYAPSYDAVIKRFKCKKSGVSPLDFPNICFAVRHLNKLTHIHTYMHTSPRK